MAEAAVVVPAVNSGAGHGTSSDPWLLPLDAPDAHAADVAAASGGVEHRGAAGRSSAEDAKEELSRKLQGMRLLVGGEPCTCMLLK